MVLSEPHLTGARVPVDPLILPPFLPVAEPITGSSTDPGLVPDQVTLPETAGALRIDGADYEDGGTAYRHPAGTGVDVALADRVAELFETGVGTDRVREIARLCARWYNYAIPNVTFAQRIRGRWVNAADFVGPESGTAAPRATPWEHPHPIHYHVQAGTIRPRQTQ